MSVIIVCPRCQRKVSVSEEALGKKVKCSGCNAVFRIESPAANPVAISSAPSPGRHLAEEMENTSQDDIEATETETPAVAIGGQKGRKKSRTGKVLAILAVSGLLFLLACAGVSYWIWTSL